MRSFAFLFLFLCLCQAAFAQSGSLPLKLLHSQTFAQVQLQAGLDADGGPVYSNSPLPNMLPFHATLTGSVTADSTMTKLAIFSDDGCDVYVDGTRVWNALDVGQALPNLSQSLHELPITMTPGQTYSIRIDYSNIYYGQPDPTTGKLLDIDGCTLFMYGAAAASGPTVVNVLTGAWQPDPAYVGDTISSEVDTRVDNPYHSPNGDSISEHWNWVTSGVYQSAIGDPGSFTPDEGNYGITWTPDNPTTTFTGIFFDAGYYIVKVTATLTYHDDTSNTDVGTYSGVGYIGGDASDLAPGSTSPAPPPPGSSPPETPLLRLKKKGVNVIPKVPGLRIYDQTGNDITGTTVTVNAGEQIALTARYNTKAGTPTINIPSWNVSNNPIGGWTPSDTAHTKPDASYTIPMPSTSATSITYFYTDETGTATPTPVTFSGSVIVNNVSTPVTGSVNFIVKKPSHSVTAVASPYGVSAGRNSSLNFDFLVLGSFQNNSEGMTFTPTGGVGGTISWQQIVQTYASTVSFSGQSITYAAHTPGLDNILTQIGNTAVDSPVVEIPYVPPPASSGVSLQESFKTYFMWTSSKAGSIPVPLAEVDWNWLGTAGADAQGFFPADPIIVPSTSTGTIKYINTVNGEVSWTQKVGTRYPITR